MAAGGLLGAPTAFLVMWTSKTFAAVISLILGRAIFSKDIDEDGNGGGLLGKMNKNPTAKRILKVLEKVGNGSDAWKLVLLLRLSPVPGCMLNYLSSLTKIPIFEYAWATALGTVPSVLNWVLIGAATREGAHALHSSTSGAAVFANPTSILRFGAIAVGFSLMIVVTRMARRIVAQVEKEIALEESTQAETP